MFGMSGLKMQETGENRGSPSVEEPNGDGNLAGSGTFKKGPWTPEEDSLLEAYVKKHGEGNWNAVQKYSGLSRCGKSCRLRWANHLRPDLKKGAFTQEEEDLIIRLHAQMGNRWARMASQLPGRTDNEIKNFWNTRIKRLHRAGQSIYPADVEQLRKSSESQQSQVSNSFTNDIPLNRNLMRIDDIEIPEFKIADSFHYQINLPNISTSNMLPEGLFPSHGFTNPLPTVHPQKRRRESDISHGLCDTATSALFGQMNGNALENPHHQSYELPHMLGSYHGIDNPSLCFLPGSHALVNGNTSTFEPNFGPVELELPSFQSSESDLIFRNAPPSPLPPPQCADTQPYSHNPNHVIPVPLNGLLESAVWAQIRVNSPEIETDPNGTPTFSLDDLLDPEDFNVDELLDDAISSDFTLMGDAIDEPQPTDAVRIPGNQANSSNADPTDSNSSNLGQLNPSRGIFCSLHRSPEVALLSRSD